MKAPRRILHIVGRMDRAGAETFLMNLYGELDRARFQFDFAYFTNEPCDFDQQIIALGGRIFRIPSGNPVTRLFRLWLVLRKGRWPVVHAHTLFSSGLFLLIAMLAGIPRRVAHSHNTSDDNSHNPSGRAYQRAMRWLLSWVSTDYVACGTAASEYLFPGRCDVQVIPNAIDIHRFTIAAGDACRQELGLTPEVLTIIQVARLMPVKNHAFSIRIAVALQDAGVEFQMLFVGTGPEQGAIEELIGKYDLNGKVRLLGLRSDIPELMAAADVMLMPSLYEGFPVTLVESQAAGLPAVISSTIAEEVDLRLGLMRFIDLNSSTKVWIEDMLAAAKSDKISIAAREVVLEARGFSARAGADRLISMYGEL